MRSGEVPATTHAGRDRSHLAAIWRACIGWGLSGHREGRLKVHKEIVVITHKCSAEEVGRLGRLHCCKCWG